MGVGNKQGFVPDNYTYWVNWQLKTVRNWYAQAIGKETGVLQCDYECSIGPINKSINLLPVPVLNLVAGNEKITCADRNLTGANCDSWLIGQNVMLRAGKEQASLGTIGSES
jgi:hypothetical protein